MRHITALSILLICLMITAAATAVPMAEENGTQENMTADRQAGNQTANMSVPDVIGQQENLTVFYDAINATNLTGALSIGGPYTIFAPTDEAFGALGNDTGNLTAVLQYHAVEGNYTAEQLLNMTAETTTGNRTQNTTRPVMLQTLLGQNLTITQENGQVMVNNASVVQADLNARNGIVHSIDAVLMPEGRAPPVPNYTFTDEDNNETVVLPLNANATVRLGENPSTGYSWNVTTTRGFVIAGDAFIPTTTNETIVGAGGIHEWRLIANRTGLQQFTAVYERAWENRTGSEERFQITALVEDNRTHLYSAADNGTTVTIPPETYGTVRLAENPTTGFSWNVSATEGLLITGDLFLQNETGLIGAGGIHEWFFRTIEEGNQTISAVYARPWENATAAADRFALEVNVSGNMTGI
ncbi:hypothetical protein FGU65_02960 [Methanoculleus sp. FWC-SCC1]|uniref:FAS1 domain-containing protein n=1 Tax=Methanoculleus frigidifontis TaxID=2584085 RepID=A0ABT8M7F7_9EURY|nr:protease inhibitor I42 family protein [Methanoculleus sp. FWC-SCC1]MDN7023860.1 hypothetical protein [Methanoculleus sp. FWC-SCC1]